MGLEEFLLDREKKVGIEIGNQHNKASGRPDSMAFWWSFLWLCNEVDTE